MGAMTRPKRAVSDGLLPIGNMRIPCYVLEDGTRLLSQRGMATTVGMSTGGGRGESGAHKIAQFAEKVELRYCRVNDLPARAELAERLRNPLIFIPLHGGNPAYGQEATILLDFCELILKCRDAGALTPTQTKFAEKADLVVRAFAKVGIIAVIDEVTGYQYRRPHDELQKILSIYVLPEHRPWVKTIPQEFTQELYRVWGWDTSSQRGPRYAGKLTRKLIYAPLPPPVLPKLDELNPADAKWQRKRRHHSYLTEGVGLQHFKAQLAGVMALLRASPNRHVFMSLFNRAFGKQLHLFGVEKPEDG
jgi:P63C domain-containing protein